MSTLPSNNNFTTLPIRISTLKALEILFLDKNKITSFPDEFQPLESLHCLSLVGNPIVEDSEAWEALEEKIKTLFPKLRKLYTKE